MRNGWRRGSSRGVKRVAGSARTALDDVPAMASSHEASTRETRRIPGSAAGCNKPASRMRSKPSRWCETTRTAPSSAQGCAVDRRSGNTDRERDADGHVDGGTTSRIPREEGWFAACRTTSPSGTGARKGNQGRAGAGDRATDRQATRRHASKASPVTGQRPGKHARSNPAPRDGERPGCPDTDSPKNRVGSRDGACTATSGPADLAPRQPHTSRSTLRRRSPAPRATL